MSFQLPLLDTQHGELEMDEALAFLDGCELCVPCDQPFEDDDGASRPSSHTGSSSSFSTASSCSDELSLVASNSSHFAHLSDSTTCGVSRASSEDAPQVRQHQLQQQMPLDLQQHAKPPELIQPGHKKKKQTARATKPAARPKIKKPRKHNRTEILKLRELVEQLQLQHSDLQKYTATAREGSIISVPASAVAAAQLATRKQGNGNTLVTATSGGDAPRSVWLELATEQYRLRQHSERLNRKLRDAVSKQLKVTNSLQALLQKKVSSQDLEFLLKAPSAPPAPPTKLQHKLLDPRELIRTALYRSAERQFRETDRVCHEINTTKDVTSVFTTSSTKQDAVLGPTSELISNTPVSSNFQLIGRLMWTRAIEKRSPSVVRSLSELQLAQTHFTRGFHEKSVQMMIPSRFGELQLEGVVVVCKFEEAHRIVMTVASAYTVKNTNFVFRENAWIVVSEAKSSTKNNTTSAGTVKKRQPWEPSPSALFQTLFRIYSERRDPRSSTGSSPFADAPDEKTEYLRQVVASVLGNHMRQHMAVLQESLLSEIESLASSMMEFNCPLAECTC